MYGFCADVAFSHECGVSMLASPVLILWLQLLPFSAALGQIYVLASDHPCTSLDLSRMLSLVP